MDRRYNQWHLQAEPGKDFRLAIDWWGWGDHVEVVTQPDDVEQSEWVAYFRLANLDGDLSNRNINFDALSSFDLAEGASNFTIDKSMKEPRIKIGGSPVTYVMRSGMGPVMQPRFSVEAG